MRIPADLHPDDHTSRQNLIDTLRRHRQNRGIFASDIDAAFGIASGSTRAIENRTSWEARTIFRYARALGRHLTFTIHDITTPDDGDVMDLILAAGDTSTPERADRVHWRLLCNDLARARRHRYTAVAMADRLGVTPNAVWDWEANPDGSSIIRAQCHARALDGHLTWNLDDCPAHAAPAQRRPPR